MDGYPSNNQANNQPGMENYPTDPSQSQPPSQPSSQPSSNLDSFSEETSTGYVPETPKKSYRVWSILFVIILVFILIPAGLIAATENGFLNIGLDKYYNAAGLEKYWNGFPIYPAKAVYQLAQNLDQTNSWHYDISLAGDYQILMTELSPISQSETSQSETSQSSSATPPQTYQTKITATGDFERPGKSKITISTDTGDLAKTYNFPTTVNSDIIVAGNQLYLKSSSFDFLTDAQKNKWFGMNFTAPQNPKYQSATKYLESEENNLKDNQLIKSYQRKKANVKGVSVYQYQIVLNKDKVKTLLSSSDIFFATDPILKLEVNKKDHLVNKIMLEGNFNAKVITGKISLTIDFSDYNKSFQIAAPGQDEINPESPFEVSALIASQFTGIGTQVSTSQTSSANNADSQRKTDLNKIKAALEKYYTAKNQYPIANVAVNTNDENSSIYKALVPTYLDQMLTDPAAPTYYYGYQSDGKSYQLTAVLENKNDSDGQQVGKYFLYIIKK